MDDYCYGYIVFLCSVQNHKKNDLFICELHEKDLIIVTR